MIKNITEIWNITEKSREIATALLLRLCGEHIMGAAEAGAEAVGITLAPETEKAAIDSVIRKLDEEGYRATMTNYRVLAISWSVLDGGSCSNA